jgi:hypothetical protein
MHEEFILRPRLSLLMNNVYIPKFKAKSFASYLYAGETEENYNNYRVSNNTNHLFGNKNRSPEDLILGIEATFDDSAASLVNSFGQIKANKQINLPIAV